MIIHASRETSQLSAMEESKEGRDGDGGKAGVEDEVISGIDRVVEGAIALAEIDGSCFD